MIDDPKARSRVIQGIAAYQHEQRALLRLLRKRGQFTASEFDKWLRGREWRRPRLRAQGLDGDSFILGWMSGSMWAVWLELLQYMAALGLVQIETIGGDITYIAVQHD